MLSTEGKRLDGSLRLSFVDVRIRLPLQWPLWRVVTLQFEKPHIRTPSRSLLYTTEFVHPGAVPTEATAMHYFPTNSCVLWNYFFVFQTPMFLWISITFLKLHRLSLRQFLSLAKNSCHSKTIAQAKSGFGHSTRGTERSSYTRFRALCGNKRGNSKYSLCNFVCFILKVPLWFLAHL